MVRITAISTPVLFVAAHNLEAVILVEPLCRPGVRMEVAGAPKVAHHPEMSWCANEVLQVFRGPPNGD